MLHLWEIYIEIYISIYFFLFFSVFLKLVLQAHCFMGYILLGEPKLIILFSGPLGKALISYSFVVTSDCVTTNPELDVRKLSRVPGVSELC